MADTPSGLPSTPSSASSPAFPSEPLRSAERAVEDAWIDYNDHMNVGYYLLAFDQALDEIYANWFGIAEDYVRKYNMGPFALQSNLHYLRELRSGERFYVEFQLLDYDHKRWRYFMSMIRAADGEVAATAEQLSMNVDHSVRRSAPMPAPVLERLAGLWEAHKDLPRPPQVGQPIGIRRRA